MIARVWLLAFWLLLANSANATSHHLYVVERSFESVQQSIKEYFATKSYRVEDREDKIFEIYFDLPELSYLKRDGFIRYRAVEYLTKKRKRVRYREKIEYSSDSNVTYHFPVKHYNSVKTFEEKHQLLSLVKRRERQSFLDRLKQDGLEYPMRLKEIVQVSKLVETYEISSDTTRVGSVSINKMEASAFGITTSFLMVDIVSKADQSIIDDLSEAIGTKDTKAIDSEYSLVFEQMERDINLFYWILRYPYLLNLLYAVALGIVGILIIFVLFRRRLLSSKVD
ncbi:MAG: hypothetical protein U9R27_04650 [Campylobacterota bacterium]|nr:hypothetical protein [Campylobacterota bacterium]